MKAGSWTRMGLVSAAALIAFSAMAQQPKVDLGKREYDNNCAVCHGRDGKGNGPYAELLRRSLPDLTTLARRNGGVFPVSKSYEVIEGAGTGHGTREMPIWGSEYNVKAADYYMDMPYDREAFVRGRILSLIEYLNRLQAK